MNTVNDLNEYVGFFVLKTKRVWATEASQVFFPVKRANKRDDTRKQKKKNSHTTFFPFPFGQEDRSEVFFIYILQRWQKFFIILYNQRMCVGEGRV